MLLLRLLMMQLLWRFTLSRLLLLLLGQLLHLLMCLLINLLRLLRLFRSPCVRRSVDLYRFQLR